MIKMDIINNLTNGLEKNAMKLSALAGFFLPYGVDYNLINIATLAGGQGHLPNIANIGIGLTQDPKFKNPLVMSIAAYVGGDILGGQKGKIVQEAAKGLAVGVISSAVLLYCTRDKEGCTQTGWTPTQVKPTVAPSSGYMARCIQ